MQKKATMLAENFSFLSVLFGLSMAVAICRHDGNQKEQSLVSKLHGVERPSELFLTYQKLVFLYVMEHCYEEIMILCCLFR